VCALIRYADSCHVSCHSQSHCTASRRNSPNSSSFSSSLNIVGKFSSFFTGKREESIGSSFVVEQLLELFIFVVSFVPDRTSWLVTTPEIQASGVGLTVIESSDLGRKGRAGVTVVIFTAGMDDLSGQAFGFENDC